MAALTWRNVDTPDFRPAMDGYRNFSQLLGNAFGGLERGLDQFDNTLDDRANTALALDFAGIQDAALAKERLASLAQNPNARRFDMATINAVAARPNALLEQAANELSLDRAQYTDKRTRGFDTAKDVAAPLMDEFFAAKANGREAEFRKANPTFGRGLSFDDTGNIIKDAQAYELGGVNIAAGRLGVDRGRWDFGNAKEDRADGEAAELVLKNVDLKSFDNESALSYLRSLSALPPKVYNAVRARIGTMFPEAASAAGGGSAASGIIAGAAGGGDFAYAAPQQAVGTELKNAGMSDAVVAGFLGNFHVEGGYGGAKGDSGSAAGIAQWRGDRQVNFKKVIGKDVTQATPAEQAKYVAWEMANPTHPSVGMTVAQRNAILAAKTPQEAAQLIDKHFERSSGEHTARRVQAANDAQRQMAVGKAVVGAGMTTAQMQRNANTINESYLKSAQDPRPIADVAAALVADKSLGGMPLGMINTELNRIVSEAAKQGKNIRAALAADILKQSLEGNSSAWSNGGWTPDFLTDKDKISVNRSRVSEIIKGYNAGEVEKAIGADADAGAVKQQHAALEAQAAAAQNRYAAAVQAQRRGVKVPNLAELAATASQYQAAVLQSLKTIGGDPSLTQFGAAGGPPARVPVRGAPVRAGRVPGPTPEQQAAQRLIMQRFSSPMFAR